MNQEAEIQKQFQYLATQLQNAEQKNLDYETKSMQQASSLGKLESSNIKYQLDFSEELENIMHVLKGDEMINEKWTPARDPRTKIFTDLGVQQIFNILQPYLSKQITLGFYEEDQINEKMRIFSKTFTQFILNRHEDFFLYAKPSDIYKNISEIKKSDSRFNHLEDTELYNLCEEWSRTELQIKINHFKMIVVMVCDLVHGAYIRALKGRTHVGITKNIHVSEVTNANMGGMMRPNKPFSLIKPSTWGR